MNNKNIIDNSFFKTLNKLQILKFKKNNNIKISINGTEYVKSWYSYSHIFNLIKNLYNAEITDSSNCDIFCMCDNDNSSNINMLNKNSLIFYLIGEPNDVNYDLYDIIIGSTIKKKNIKTNTMYNQQFLHQQVQHLKSITKVNKPQDLVIK